MPQQTLRTDNEGRIAIVVMCDGGKAAERESFVINLKGGGGRIMDVYCAGRMR
jgi:hypothetical protein